MRQCTPELVSFIARGFDLTPAKSVSQLEASGRAFVAGFQAILSAPASPHITLEAIPADGRGFAYEGAGFAAGLLSVEGRPSTLRSLRADEGWRYRHLIHVGVGWAMAALRCRLSQIWRLDPLLGGLAYNGYGFSKYFLARPEQRPRLVSQLRPSTAGRIIAQGMGRAMWWEAAANPDHIVDRIRPARPLLRGDFLCGAALAAVYAGQGAPGSGQYILRAAGSDAPHVAVGALFGAVARHSHGHNVEVAGPRLAEFCPRLSVDDAANLAESATQGLDTIRTPMAYLIWQERLAASSIL